MNSVENAEKSSSFVFTKYKEYDSVDGSSWLEVHFTKHFMNAVPDVIRISGGHVDGNKSLSLVEIVDVGFGTFFPKYCPFLQRRELIIW